MMDMFIVATILGIIEGFTEFLPISSTGHLILMNSFFGFSGTFENMFNVVIQLGAIIAVMIYFRKKIIPLNRDVRENKLIVQLWLKIMLATVPALIIGFFFGDWIQQVLFTPVVVVSALFVGGILLIVIEKWFSSPRITSLYSITYTSALLIGMIQCLAMIPGTSRAAATIMGAMILGCSRIIATEFSFYVAIPTMIAASSYSLINHASSLSIMEGLSLVIGFMTAFVVAWLVIDKLLGYLKHHDLKIFGYYRIILASILFLYYLLH